MELDLDSWKERVANPEALGDREKTLWKKMEPVLNEVLNEMKTNGKIETVYIKAERDRLIGPLKILEETSVAHNNLIHVFEMAEQDRSLFFETMRRFAFDEASVVGMYLTLTGALTVLCTELFKLFLLFHMKDVNHNVSRFSYTMRTVAPRSWPKLKPFVDNDFRNALAHGTYAYVGKKVVLYRDAKLIPFEEMELHEFMMRSKDQNVLFHCFIYVLLARKGASFFTLPL